MKAIIIIIIAGYFAVENFCGQVSSISLNPQNYNDKIIIPGSVARCVCERPVLAKCVWGLGIRATVKGGQTYLGARSTSVAKDV